MANSISQVTGNDISRMDYLHNNSLDSQLNKFGYLINTGNCAYPTEHWHGGIEILVVHNGIMEVDLGSDSVELVPGSVAAFTSDKVHATQPCGGEYVRTALHFIPDSAVGTPAFSLISEIQDHCGFRLFTLNPDVMHRFLWCISELNTLRGSYNTHLTSKHILGLILTDIYASKAFDPSPPVLRNVVDYMQTHLRNREQLAEVAAQFFVSERHLTRLFRIHLNSSPQEYWLRLRIKRACEILRCSTTIKDVADIVGFNSLSGFQRAFRQMIGLSPSQYQELCQDNKTIEC